MAYEMEGTLKLVEDEQTFASGFNKREFVLTTMDGTYSQEIKFELVKDKTSLIGGFKAGDNLKVSFDIRGREYNGRYYVNLVAWKIDGADEGADGTDGADERVPEDTTDYSKADDGEDIPF